MPGLGRIWPGFALLVAFLSSGCASQLAPAVSAYDQSRYPDAIDALRRAEPEMRHFDANTRLRYRLYRGLTHLALGDAERAEFWLRGVERDVQRRSFALTADEYGRLDAAWRALGHMPGDI
jgi:hypothetical protein